MKQLKFLLIVISITLCFTGFAQISVNPNDPNNAPYLGTWEYQDGNQVFRLFLEEDTEPGEFNRYWIIGHYEMVEVDSVTGQETLIYTSRPQPVPARQGAILGFVNNNINILSGSFREYHAHGLPGSFGISIEPSCPTCPKKIRWEVTREKGSIFHFEGDPVLPNTYEVPTDIVLEKVD